MTICPDSPATHPGSVPVRSGALSTVRTILVRSVEGFSTGHANGGLTRRRDLPSGGRRIVTHGLLAVLAQQKRRALLDPDQRNEKQAQVVVDPGGISLHKTAGRTALRVLIHPPGSGLYAGDQKHANLDGLVKSPISALRLQPSFMRRTHQYTASLFGCCQAWLVLYKKKLHSQYAKPLLGDTHDGS